MLNFRINWKLLLLERQSALESQRMQGCKHFQFTEFLQENYRWLIFNSPKSMKRFCGAGTGEWRSSSQWLDTAKEVTNATPWYTPQPTIHSIEQASRKSNLRRPTNDDHIKRKSKLSPTFHPQSTDIYGAIRNSFVYSLKETHCFFIYNFVIDIVYAQLNFPLSSNFLSVCFFN